MPADQKLFEPVTSALFAVEGMTAMRTHDVVSLNSIY